MTQLPNALLTLLFVLCGFVVHLIIIVVDDSSALDALKEGLYPGLHLA